MFKKLILMMIMSWRGIKHLCPSIQSYLKMRKTLRRLRIVCKVAHSRIRWVKYNRIVKRPQLRPRILVQNRVTLTALLSLVIRNTLVMPKRRNDEHFIKNKYSFKISVL